VGGLFAQSSEAGPPPAILQIVPWILVFAVFYLLFLRPEQKRRKDHERLVAALKRNDQVVMTSGIHGRVAAIGDSLVTIEIAPRVQVQVERSAIQTVTKATAAEPRDKEREKS
jgi:preprotein translocase subunit YajC